MFTIGGLSFAHPPLLLAPMEDVTTPAFRRICIDYGADLVFTEFVNADGLVRGCPRAARKMVLDDNERPIGIQIYGADVETMTRAARLAEERSPDLIDINAGCWVKKVSRRGAGAGLLRDMDRLEQMAVSVVKAVRTPVTLKTRLGWDQDSLNILEVARRVQGAGVQALTIHCRTRAQGLSGEADWSWVNRLKQEVEIPVILNGGLMEISDFQRALGEAPADGYMVARGAIGAPWLFHQAKGWLQNGRLEGDLSRDEKAAVCLRHLSLEIEYKKNSGGDPREQEERAVKAFRKFYAGYFKGLPGSKTVRQKVYRAVTYNEIEDILGEFGKL